MWIFPQMVCHARFRNPCLPTLQNFLPPKKTWFLNKLAQIHNVWKSLKNSHFSTSRESKIHFSILNSHFSNCQNSHFRKITLFSKFTYSSYFQTLFKNYLWYHMNHCSGKKDSTSKTQKNRSHSSFPSFVIIDKILPNFQGNKSQNKGNASQKHHGQILSSIQVHLVSLILQEWMITQLQKCKAKRWAYLFKAIAVKKPLKQ